jgi:uncharacterized repeat protein (TIGR01451 family)
MKKLLHVFLAHLGGGPAVIPICLLLVFLGLPGCSESSTSPTASQVKPASANSPVSNTAGKPVIAAPAPAAPNGARARTQVRQTSLPESESNQIMVSRLYPAPEFPIIRMDKITPKEVSLKKAFGYSIRVTNLTDATLTNVVVTEELSGNFKYTSSEPAARENAANLVWKIDSLAPRASEQILVSGMATDTNTLKLSTSVVTHFVPAYTDIKVVQPRLELTQTAPARVTLCDVIPVEFKVTNAGTGSARNARIDASLSEGLQTVDGNSKFSLDIGTLAENQTRQFSAKLRAAKAGKYVSEGVVSAAGLKDVSQRATINVDQPVLVVKKTGPEKQYVGRPLTYEITVTNQSDAIAKNVVIEDSVPQAVTTLKATAGSKLYRSRNLVWQFDSLEPEVSKKVYVSYVPTRVGTVADKTTVTAFCADSVTASAETLVAGISGVLLEVIDLEDPIEIGNTTMYEIKVTNQGSAVATGIRITCSLESNIQYVSSRGKTAGSMEGNVLKFAPLASLTPKAEATWRVVVKALEPADTFFKVAMSTDQLSRPVEKTETTHLYK